MLCIFNMVNILYEFVVVTEHFIVLCKGQRVLWVEVVSGQVDIVSPEVSLFRIQGVVALSDLRLIH